MLCVLLGCFAASAPSALGADFMWSGASTSSTNWSDSANWQGGIAPSPADSVGTVDFPGCPNGTACTSHNDVSSLTIDQLDLFAGMTLDGDGITLNGGLSSSNPGTSELTDVQLPITLGASQSWSTSGFSWLQFGQVSGSASSLSIENNGVMYFNDAEVGPISVVQGALGGDLNYDDGNRVDISGFLEGPSDVGQLTMSGGGIDLSASFQGWPYSLGGDVAARSVRFDSSASFQFAFYSELRSAGLVSLGSALLLGNCPAAGEIGQTSPLVSTTGTLRGKFSGTPGGRLFPANCSNAYRIRYNRTASPRTVTATVIGSSKTSLSCPSGPLSAGSSIRCTVTVADAAIQDPSRPTGRVSIRSVVSRDAASCRLAGISRSQSRCAVTLPVDYASLQGSHVEVRADYPGDPLHLPSRGTTLVSVSGGGGSLVAFPVEAREGTPFADGVVGSLVVPRGSGSLPQASDYVASIDWGDGTASKARLVPAVSSGDQIVFKVVASHRYDSTDPTSFILRVGHPGGPAIPAQGKVVVDSRHPQAFFIASPDNPDQNTLGLLIPKDPAPDQDKLIAWQWDFGDGNRVLDDSQTHPMYMNLLAKLKADPGNDKLRHQAIAIGILPEDANGGPGGLGDLSDKVVGQVAEAWLKYFPDHIVPHMWDYYTPPGAGVGVKLTTKDASGALSEYVQNLTVSHDVCYAWGGPLSGLFQGYTTCDTWNGIKAQFGPHRDPDYVSFDITHEVDKKLNLPVVRKLSFGAGVSLSIMLGSSPTATRVFLTLHGSAGVGVPLPTSDSASIGYAYAGPPGPEHHPKECQIANFIGGPTFSGGFTLGIGVAGVGFNAIYSPGGSQPPDCPGYTAGEEYLKGFLGADATLSVACSAPVSDITNGAAQLAHNIYEDFSDASKNVDSRILTDRLHQLLVAIIQSGRSIGGAAINAMKQCVTG